MAGVFDEIRAALHDLLHGNVPLSERRDAFAAMKATLAQAQLAVEDMRAGVAATRQRLEAEERELATVRRRKGLAEGIGDLETVAVAARFESVHAERVAVLTRKLEAGLEELALAERELEEMRSQFKAAVAGVGSGLGSAGAVESEGVEQELGVLERARRRAAAEAEARARLDELKRRMGK
jgi:hypothetical protein